MASLFGAGQNHRGASRVFIRFGGGLVGGRRVR